MESNCLLSIGFSSLIKKYFRNKAINGCILYKLIFHHLIIVDIFYRMLLFNAFLPIKLFLTIRNIFMLLFIFLIALENDLREVEKSWLISACWIQAFSKSKKHWFLKCKKTGNHLFLKKMFCPGSKNFFTWFCFFFFFLYSWSNLFKNPLFSLQSLLSLRDKI